MQQVEVSHAQIVPIINDKEQIETYRKLIADILCKRFLKKQTLDALEPFLLSELPFLVTSDFDTPPCSFSFYLLCKKRKSIGKFFLEIVSRWAVPGKIVSTPFCFICDFALDGDLEKVYTIAKLQISLLGKWDLEVLKKNLEVLLQEIKLGASSSYHAHHILEVRGISSSEKIGLVQEKITELMERFPKRFDYDVFTLMQHFFLISREEFKSIRETTHLVRVISSLYFLRQELIKSQDSGKQTRQIFVQLKRTKLKLPLGIKNVLAVCVGIGSLRENELFTKRHLVRAIQTLVPSVKVIEESYLEIEEGDYPIHFLYLEMEREDKDIFSIEDVQLLKEELPSHLLARVEHLLRPVFMPRNEEEVMRNILILSHQLKYVKDLPQVMISFDEQTDKILRFTVIIVRVLDKSSVALASYLKMINPNYELLIERERKLGKIRNKYDKEASVIRFQLPVTPFLREDDSVDLYAARKEIVNELEKAVGDLRDYNGGMLSKQSETFLMLKKLLGKTAFDHKLLLENFFHSIYPIESRSILNPEYLKILFTMILNKNLKSSRGFTVQVSEEESVFLALIEFHELGIKQNVVSEITKLGISSRKLVQMHLQTVSGIYLGYVLLEHAEEKRKIFLKALQAALDI